MAGTMVEYVREHGDDSFWNRPFCDVDSLVLSQLSYYKLDGVVPDMDSGAAPIALWNITWNPEWDNLFVDARSLKLNQDFWDAVRCSKRFSELQLGLYENIVDMQHRTQFSAITFFMEGQLPFVAFRGTDESIVGWKEDFYMAFEKPVIGQLIAVKYLNHAAARFSGEFLVGGHSKGGNLAVFAAMNCEPSVQERILKIYDHDGPGIRQELLRDGKYERIAGRIQKIMPQSAVIGMLLQTQEHYEVIKCNNIGLLQHNPFCWQVEQCDFVRVQDIKDSQKLMDEVLNQWIWSLSQEELKIFIDTMFAFLEASKQTSLLCFAREWKKSVMGILETARQVEPETKEKMLEIIGKFWDVIVQRMKEEWRG